MHDFTEEPQTGSSADVKCPAPWSQQRKLTFTSAHNHFSNIKHIPP